MNQAIKFFFDFNKISAFFCVLGTSLTQKNTKFSVFYEIRNTRRTQILRNY
jgi:hypothetical protein